MKTKALGVALAVGLATALLVPPAAEAGHRHSRGCHGSSYYGSGYGYGGYGGGYGYGGYGGGYGYGGYGYSPSYRYVPPPPPVPYYYSRPSYHRHYRGCGHSGYGSYGYGGYGYGGYGYGGPRVALHYHGGVPCSRSHVSIQLGF